MRLICFFITKCECFDFSCEPHVAHGSQALTFIVKTKQNLAKSQSAVFFRNNTSPDAVLCMLQVILLIFYLALIFIKKDLICWSNSNFFLRTPLNVFTSLLVLTNFDQIMKKTGGVSKTFGLQFWSYIKE